MRYGLLLAAAICGAPAAPARAAAPAPELYAERCAMCHLPGIAGAPKVGDRSEWLRRIRPGMNRVYRNALEGMPNTAMLARGGHDDLSPRAVREIVDYMIAAAGLPADALAAAARYDALGIANPDFIGLDANFDGSLSPDEVAADTGLARNFQRFDANGDGRLSVAEYEAAESTLERERMAVAVPDADLAAAVRGALATVNGVDLPNTQVAVSGGAVSIVGIVDTADAVRRAHDAVKRIPGIRKIDNRLVSGHQMGWD